MVGSNVCYVCAAFVPSSPWCCSFLGGLFVHASQFDELLNIVELAIMFSCMSSADLSFSWMRQAHPVQVSFVAGSVTHFGNLSYYTARVLMASADSQPTLHVVKASISEFG